MLLTAVWLDHREQVGPVVVSCERVQIPAGSWFACIFCFAFTLVAPMSCAWNEEISIVKSSHPQCGNNFTSRFAWS